MAQRSEVARPTVIRISPVAHFAIGFFFLALTIPVAVWSAAAPVLVVPLLASAAVERWRTTAGPDGLTARGLVRSRDVAWDELRGLKFDRGSWGRAVLADGDEVRLPAVTFVTVPLLTEASGGRVPNPYRQG